MQPASPQIFSFPKKMPAGSVATKAAAIRFEVEKLGQEPTALAAAKTLIAGKRDAYQNAQFLCRPTQTKNLAATVAVLKEIDGKLELIAGADRSTQRPPTRRASQASEGKRDDGVHAVTASDGVGAEPTVVSNSGPRRPSAARQGSGSSLGSRRSDGSQARKASQVMPFASDTVPGLDRRPPSQLAHPFSGASVVRHTPSLSGDHIANSRSNSGSSRPQANASDMVVQSISRQASRAGLPSATDPGEDELDASSSPLTSLQNAPAIRGALPRVTSGGSASSRIRHEPESPLRDNRATTARSLSGGSHGPRSAVTVMDRLATRNADEDGDIVANMLQSAIAGTNGVVTGRTAEVLFVHHSASDRPPMAPTSRQSSGHRHLSGGGSAGGFGGRASFSSRVSSTPTHGGGQGIALSPGVSSIRSGSTVVSDLGMDWSRRHAAVLDAVRATFGVKIHPATLPHLHISNPSYVIFEKYKRPVAAAMKTAATAPAVVAGVGAIPFLHGQVWVNVTNGRGLGESYLGANGLGEDLPTLFVQQVQNMSRLDLRRPVYVTNCDVVPSTSTPPAVLDELSRRSDDLDASAVETSGLAATDASFTSLPASTATTTVDVLAFQLDDFRMAQGQRPTYDNAALFEDMVAGLLHAKEQGSTRVVIDYTSCSAAANNPVIVAGLLMFAARIVQLPIHFVTQKGDKQSKASIQQISGIVNTARTSSELVGSLSKLSSVLTTGGMGGGHGSVGSHSPVPSDKLTVSSKGGATGRSPVVPVKAPQGGSDAMNGVVPGVPTAM